MSIIYKGLNPKHHYGLCILTINGELITADGKHFQAIQIPTPHGRLIDVDALGETVMEINSKEAYITRNDYKLIENVLFKMLTILEAEE